MEIGVSRSLWLLPAGMARGLGPPPLASVKPQSPHSGVHLRVGDIFRGRLEFYFFVELALHVVAR